MKLSREIKTAIIVLGGILLFVLGFSYLKSNPIFKNYRTYYVVYDHVGGLAVGTPVTLNGFSVGHIKDIRFKDFSGKLLVTFTIENDFKFSQHSIAQLYDTGIIGGKGIQIIPVFDNTPFAKSGDTLQGDIKPGLTELVTQKLTPLEKKLGDMLVSADSVLLNVNGVLDNKTRKNLQNSVAELSEITSSFKKISESVEELVAGNKDKLNETLGNVQNLSSNLSRISDSLAAANFGKTIKDLQSSIAHIEKTLSGIAEGEGSIGMLMKDKKLYENLANASEQLELLMEDMRLNPKRYVHFSLFGKKPKPYEPAATENQENK